MGWNLPKGEDFLPTISLRALRSLYDEEKSYKAKSRLLVALKRKEGESMDSIASQLEMKRITVNITLHRFQERGIPAKDDEKRSGRPKELTGDQLKILRKELLKGPRKRQNPLWTTKMVMNHVEKRYGKKYTARHMRRLLHLLGFSVQKPRPRHYKTDIAKQEHFKKTSGKPSGNIENGASQYFVWTRASSP
ncbi:winged helix-turn-helix domain-containing protein [Candidatus Micrarchaeota archaeon]|nr:winged helix-turn-helix domain-containing protein [Candidatus Micrarchaeota archaeon]